MVVYMGDKSVYIYGPSGLERSVNQLKEASKVTTPTQFRDG